MEKKRKGYILPGVCFLLLALVELLQSPMPDQPLTITRMLGYGIGYLLLALYCFFFHARKAGVWVFIAAFAVYAGHCLFLIYNSVEGAGIWCFVLELLLCTALVLAKTIRHWSVYILTVLLLVLYVGLYIITGIFLSLLYSTDALEPALRVLMIAFSWMTVLCRCIGFVSLFRREQPPLGSEA